jgi:hypothetical protein
LISWRDGSISSFFIFSAFILAMVSETFIRILDDIDFIAAFIHHALHDKSSGRSILFSST